MNFIKTIFSECFEFLWCFVVLFKRNGCRNNFYWNINKVKTSWTMLDEWKWKRWAFFSSLIFFFVQLNCYVTLTTLDISKIRVIMDNVWINCMVSQYLIEIFFLAVTTLMDVTPVFQYSWNIWKSELTIILIFISCLALLQKKKKLCKNYICVLD